MEGAPDLSIGLHVLHEVPQEPVMANRFRVTDDRNVAACSRDRDVDPTIFGQETDLPWNDKMDSNE